MSYTGPNINFVTYSSIRTETPRMSDQKCSRDSSVKIKTLTTILMSISPPSPRTFSPNIFTVDSSLKHLLLQNRSVQSPF